MGRQRWVGRRRRGPPELSDHDQAISGGTTACSELHADGERGGWFVELCLCKRQCNGSSQRQLRVPAQHYRLSSSKPGAGHLLICAATWQSSTATASMSDPNNGAWTAIGAAKTGVGSLSGYRGQMFYVPSAVNAPTTVTLTISSAVVFRAFECAEYSYTGTIAALDGTPQYSTTPASGGVATISGLTTSNSNDLVFADCLGVDTTCTAGSGYTGLNDTNTYDYGRGQAGQISWVTGQLIEYKVGAAAGAQSATFGTGTSTDNVILGLVGGDGGRAQTPPIDH